MQSQPRELSKQFQMEPPSMRAARERPACRGLDQQRRVAQQAGPERAWEAVRPEPSSRVTEDIHGWSQF